MTNIKGNTFCDTDKMFAGLEKIETKPDISNMKKVRVAVWLQNGDKIDGDITIRKSYRLSQHLKECGNIIALSDVVINGVAASTFILERRNVLGYIPIKE